eukprot:2441951-Amphidinium_carterae.1
MHFMFAITVIALVQTTHCYCYHLTETQKKRLNCVWRLLVKRNLRTTYTISLKLNALSELESNTIIAMDQPKRQLLTYPQSSSKLPHFNDLQCSHSV